MSPGAIGPGISHFMVWSPAVQALVLYEAPAASTTLVISLSGWSLTKSRLPSALTASPRGLPPALNSATTVSVAISMTDTVPLFSLGT